VSLKVLLLYFHLEYSNVYICRLTYSSQSISRQLKSPPTKWISLDLFGTVILGSCYRDLGNSVLSVVAGVSDLLRFLFWYVH